MTPKVRSALVSMAFAFCTKYSLRVRLFKDSRRWIVMIWTIFWVTKKGATIEKMKLICSITSICPWSKTGHMLIELNMQKIARNFSRTWILFLPLSKHRTITRTSRRSTTSSWIELFSIFLVRSFCSVVFYSWVAFSNCRKVKMLYIKQMAAFIINTLMSASKFICWSVLSLFISVNIIL